MDAVIYTRFSKLAGARSTGEQEQESRSWCGRSGYPVRAVFTENVSASRFAAKDRPEWKKVKQTLRQGDILVVWEASRGYRDMEEFVELRNLCAGLNVPLAYAGKVMDLTLGDDRFVAGLDALLAERESEQISLRVLRAKRASAEAGRPSGRPPWGYRLARPGEWELDPIEAPRVQGAVARLLGGDSQRSVMRWLEETVGWTPSSLTGLQRTLCNPALAGMRVHRGEVVGVGIWKPLISEDDHYRLANRIAAMKAAYKFVSPPGPEPKYLLSGIAKCKCGAGLEYKRFRNRNPAYSCPRGHCCRTAEPLDRMIEERVFEKAAITDPEEHEDDDQAIAEALAEITRIDGELRHMHERVGNGRMTLDDFEGIAKHLRNRRDQLDLELKTAGRERLTQEDYAKFKAAWPTMSMRDRREIVRVSFTITVMPFERDAPEVCAVEECGRTKIYARGLCKGCYLKAWRGKAPMPPLREPHVGRVIIEEI